MELGMLLQPLENNPIKLSYKTPSSEIISDLQKNKQICVIEPVPGLHVDHTYFKAKYGGTFATMFTRHAVYQRLLAINQLLAPHNGLFIFDVFRTKATQLFLYEKFSQDIKAKNPHFSEEELFDEVSKYVAVPSLEDTNDVPPHNSGGAVDLAIYDRASGKLWDFGSEFDETAEISHVDFFEKDFDSNLGISEVRWKLIRKNRRILFHLMCQHDFIGLPTEWWHYDLGDRLWAQQFNLDWSFSSLEPEVMKIISINADTVTA